MADEADIPYPGAAWPLAGAPLAGIYPGLEIVGALYVSEGTVKTHINHPFAKLGLRDRAAAVVFAHEHKILPASR